MADPQQEFVHPIIEAMTNAYQLMQRAKNQKFEQDLDTRKQELSQAQFDEAKRQHDIEQGNFNKQFDINKALLEVQRKQHQLDALKTTQQLLASGVKPEVRDLTVPINTLPGAPMQTIAGAGGSFLPGTDIPINASAFPSQDEAQNRALDFIGKQAQATTQGQMAAQEPFKKEESARAEKARLNEIGLQGENAAKVAATNHQNDIELENLRGHFQLAAAQIAHNQNRENLAPVFTGALNSIMDGQTSYSTLPKDIKEGVSQLAATKGWALPTNQKDYSAKLDAVTNIQGLLNQYRDLALNYSRDSPNTGSIGKVSAFITNGGAIPGTELRSKIDALKSNGGSLASFFDKQNRKSDAEILRAVVGLFDPRATVQENLDKIKQHLDPLNSAVKGIFAGFKPDQLNYVLGNRGIQDLGGFSLDSSKSSKNKGKVGIQLNDGTVIPDTPQNRQLNGIALDATPE